MSNGIPVPNDLHDRVVAALRVIGEPARACWLVFVFKLPESGTQALVGALQRLGLESDEAPASGFVYLKMRRPRQAGDLCRAIGDVDAVCSKGDGAAVAVDLDESEDDLQHRVINLIVTP